MTPQVAVDRIRACSQVHNTITKGLLSNPRKTAPENLLTTSMNGYESKHLLKFMTYYPRIII